VLGIPPAFILSQDQTLLKYPEIYLYGIRIKTLIKIFFFFISTRFRLTGRVEKCQPLKHKFLYFLFKNFLFYLYESYKISFIIINTC
jgi:hypothetical protein